mmetsp:Transcript_112817/g.329701  ORF Transcript_112817/g.329701 Transcript_112817/m.329701 type:complete len:163 (+) Transcript_112817:993-1481(+)
MARLEDFLFGEFVFEYLFPKVSVEERAKCKAKAKEDDGLRAYMSELKSVFAVREGIYRDESREMYGFGYTERYINTIRDKRDFLEMWNQDKSCPYPLTSAFKPIPLFQIENSGVPPRLAIVLESRFTEHPWSTMLLMQKSGETWTYDGRVMKAIIQKIQSLF